MANKKGKPKQQRKMLWILLPVLAIIFLIGWTLYMLGDEQFREKKKKVVTSPKKDNVHFMPNIPSDEKEIISE